MYPHKCTLKNLKKKYQEKWENAYLRLKNARASRALRRALDPGRYWLALLALHRFATSAKSRQKFLGPPPWPNPGSASDFPEIVWGFCFMIATLIQLYYKHVWACVHVCVHEYPSQCWWFISFGKHEWFSLMLDSFHSISFSYISRYHQNVSTKERLWEIAWSYDKIIVWKMRLWTATASALKRHTPVLGFGMPSQ